MTPLPPPKNAAFGAGWIAPSPEAVERERLHKLARARCYLRKMSDRDANVHLANFIVSVFSSAKGIVEMGQILDRKYSQGSPESQQFIEFMANDIKKQLIEQLGVDFDELRKVLHEPSNPPAP